MSVSLLVPNRMMLEFSTAHSDGWDRALVFLRIDPAIVKKRSEFGNPQAVIVYQSELLALALHARRCLWLLGEFRRQNTWMECEHGGIVVLAR
jgi:hypothetical protein